MSGKGKTSSKSAKGKASPKPVEGWKPTLEHFDDEFPKSYGK